MKTFSRLILMICAASIAVLGQSITASLDGIVSDLTGAVIPGAKVQIINSATNAVVSLEANAEGRFVAPSLPAGIYEITIEATGFKQLRRSGVELRVGQAVRMDFVLEVGAISESVQVTGAPPLLEATTSSLGQVVDNRRIVDLPLNERNTYALIFLVPGVTGSTSSNWIKGNLFSINGGRRGSSDILLDGVPSAPPQDFMNTTSIYPSVEAVQEFKVQTSSYPAEYGRSGGGIVNLIYKSGGNEFHGSVFEFLRNSKLDANNFFANSVGTPLDSFKRNQFGFSLGGPLTVPGIYSGRNKTFFFMNYEGLRERLAQALTATVPTARVRAGDFSQSFNSAGRLITIYDPLTTAMSGTTPARQPFPDNRIPANRIDSVANNIARYWPEPNTPGNTLTNINNYAATASKPTNVNQGDLKIDHNFSDRSRLSGRYSRRFWDDPPATFFRGDSGVAEPGNFNSTNSNSAALDYTLTHSPSFLVNLRYGFTRTLWRLVPRGEGFDPTALGFPSYIKENADMLYMPSIAPAGYYRIGHSNTGYGRVGFDTHSLQSVNTKVFTRHLVKFGGEVRSYWQNTAQAGRATGAYNFEKAMTQGPNPLQASSTAGEGFATFLLGVGSGTLIQSFKQASAQSSYFAGFVSDDWRVSPTFTLNLGVRYEVEIPRTERYNRTNYFDPTVPHPLSGPSGIAGLHGGLVFVGVDGVGRRPFPIDGNNFSPRVGFAWQPSRKLVLRGAYGVFFAPSPQQAAGTIGQTGFRADNQYLGSIDGLTPYAYLRDPFPDGFLERTGSKLGLMTFVGQAINAPLRDAAIPYTQNWNFGIQHEISETLLVEASYVGSRGVQLMNQSVYLNQLHPSYLARGTELLQNVDNPFYGLISSGVLANQKVQQRYLLREFPHFDGVLSSFHTGSSSTYHSFQLKAEKRFSSGLGFLLAYTNAKSIDDASLGNNNTGTDGTQQNYFDRRSERSLSTFDVSQRLVFSWVYALPWGRGRTWGSNWTGAVDAVLGGWQINGIATLERGVPLALSASNTSQAFNKGLRPNNSGTSAKRDGAVHERLNQYFATSAFSQPAPFMFGNTSRTLPNVRSDGVRNFDLSLFKQFKLRERATLEFRAELFNAFNTPRFGEPGVTLGSNAFGVVSSQVNPARQAQFGAKLLF